MKEKRCRGCGEIKPLSEFYRHPRMADGHLNHCKVCKRADAARRAARIAADPEAAGKEAERQRRKSLRQYHERHKHDPEYWSRHREITRAWDERHPEKRQAHNAVRRAVERGELVRPDCCEECGDEGPVHAHHDDYSKPLVVRWLCVPCHFEHHRKAA